MRLSPIGDQRYRLTFLSGVNNETEFNEVLTDDLDACLGTGDELLEPTWASRSVVVVTSDLAGFLRRLAVQRMIVERDA